jgi:hypothetical protein
VSPRTLLQTHLGNKKGDPIWVALAIGRYLRPVSGRLPPSEGIGVGRDLTTRHHGRMRESGLDDGGEV